MDLYHYDAPRGNFGDDLNLWLWDEILPGWRDARPGHLLIGVGTLINHKLPRGVPKLVMGSGVGYGRMPDAGLLAECTFAAVRGPRSAAALGLAPEKGIVDPAVMIPELPSFRNVPKSGPPVFVPHLSSVYRADWVSLCARAGVDYVSPEGDARTIIRKLAAAPLVIAESMHAAILADAFGTPWRAVSISHHFNAAKWQDWAESLGLTLKVEPFYPLMDLVARTVPKRGMAGAAIADLSDVPVADPGLMATSGHGGPARGRGGLPFRLRARIALEKYQAVLRLRSLARGPGQLSDRAALQSARQRYRQVLDCALRME